MNGYFQIQVNEKGVSLLLSPPIGEGEKIRVNELREYLDMIGVSYDAMAINSALYSLGDEEVVIFLSPVRIPPVDEKYNIYVSPDRMTATLRMYPPSAGGLSTSKAHIMDTLNEYKITAGIDEAAIRAALEDRQYCTDIVVAKGKTPTAGRDASIVYHFDTNNSSRPELKEDGSVDFFKLNTLHHCTKGQVLAEIIPEEKGEDGIDVFGTVTQAREVRKMTFAHGRNLEISPDGLQLISMVDGHASLVDGTVFVSDVYSVENVSTSTGNIEYHGNVEVKGNVCENFSVKTDGDVFVQGVVEGAVIEAGGNIIIARGMHGQNKGRLRAGGNIIAKFISAADVEADGFVEAEQILNAKVLATSVNAEAGKGLITGGKVIAKSSVCVKNAGSPMGAATVIEVGGDPEAKKRLVELQKSVGELSRSMPQIKKVLEDTAAKLKAGAKLTNEQLRNAKMLQETLQQSQEQINEQLREIEKLDKLLKGGENAHIDVRGTMHQGVMISISGATLNIKNEYTFCRLIKKGADIASTNL
jgi:hypothetical protein